MSKFRANSFFREAKREDQSLRLGKTFLDRSLNNFKNLVGFPQEQFLSRVRFAQNAGILFCQKQFWQAVSLQVGKNGELFRTELHCDKPRCKGQCRL